VKERGRGEGREEGGREGGNEISSGSGMPCQPLVPSSLLHPSKMAKAYLGEGVRGCDVPRLLVYGGGSTSPCSAVRVQDELLPGGGRKVGRSCREASSGAACASIDRQERLSFPFLRLFTGTCPDLTQLDETSPLRRSPSHHPTKVWNFDRSHFIYQDAWCAARGKPRQTTTGNPRGTKYEG